jgi:glycosyltransferase involved in cell wall biosynthesis
MRVTFVHKTANFSGGNRVVATYAERLAQRGHQVCVVTGPGERPRPLRKVINRWKGRSFSASDGRSWLDELQLEHRVLTSAGPPRAEDVPDADVIVATWWETAEWIAALPASKGAKAYFLQGVEWTIDDMPRERVRQTWRLPLHKIVIAEFMADIARVDFGDSDLSHVPNAVDTQLFHAPPRERNAVPTVGLMDVGPLAIKGGDITRAALLLAKQQLPELRGVCFGRSHPPPERALPSWVSMQLSPTPEALRALYASCDVFIHASRAEGFGLPLLEAMACRTPVAATPAGAAPELLPSGGGLLVPHDDPAALASALVRVCTLPRDEWRARSDAAFTRATTYTLDDATQRMEAALERAITKTQRGEHARASARGDAGPVPPLASQVHQLAQGMGSRQTDVGEHRLLPALLAAPHVAELAHEVAQCPGSAWTQPTPADQHTPWLRGEHLPTHTRALLDALTHPATLAALEDFAGTSRLLLDPHGREQGVLRGDVSRGPRRSFHVRYQDPPLERRWTLLVPLTEHSLALDDTRTGARERVTLLPGDVLLVAAGLTRVIDTAGLTALVLPLHQAGPIPDGLPSLDEQVLPADAPDTLGRLRQQFARHATQARARQQRELARLRERFLGLY